MDRGDWAGWLLLCVSFAVIPLFVSPRKKGSSVLAIWSTLLVRHALAVANAFFGMGIKADGDSPMFHQAASMAASSLDRFDFGVGAQFYSSALGVVYWAGGASLFLGDETSILAFSLSCVLFLKMMELLEIPGPRAWLLLAYGLLPAGVVYTSYTMREAWQVLFFIAAAYGMLRFRLRSDWGALVPAVLAAAGLGMLHNGLIVYALCLVALGLLWRFSPDRGLTWRGLASAGLSAAVLVGVAGAIAWHKLPKSEALQAAMSGDSVAYAERYRRAHIAYQARAAYGVSLDTSSPLRFASSGARLCLCYMLAPFPWQISSGLDAYMAVENVCRLGLLFLSVRAWKTTADLAKRRALLFLLTLYIFVTLLFALGTINWGTAIRHHLLGNWLVLLIGGSELLRRLDARDEARACGSTPS